MTDSVPDDAASEIFTDAAESVFEVESLYETNSIAPTRDDDAHQEVAQSATVAQAAKAIEVATERIRPRRSTLEGGEEGENEADQPVMRDAGPAPPDYTAATAWRRMSPVEEASHAVDRVPDMQVQSTGHSEPDRRDLNQRMEDDGGYLVQPRSEQRDPEVRSAVGTAGNATESELSFEQLVSAIKPGIRMVWEKVEPRYNKVVDIVQPTIRITWKKVEPQYKRLAVAVEPVARKVWEKLEPQCTKAAAVVGPRFQKAAEVIDPVLKDVGSRAERRLRKIAVANEPRITVVWNHVEPASKKAAAVMRPAIRMVVKQADGLQRLLVNKHSIAFMRKHWLHILLVNVAFTFALLFLVTSVRPPRYRNYEVFPDYYSSHPRRGWPGLFHHHSGSCQFDQFSEFSHTEIERSGDFSFEEAIDLAKPAKLRNISLSGRIDVRPAPIAQNSPIAVYVNTATTWPWEAVPPKMVIDGSTLRIKMPRWKEDEYAQSRRQYGGYNGGPRQSMPCMDIWVGIYVNIEMENIYISTDHFSVNIDDVEEQSSWGLTAKQKIHISTKDGDVDNHVDVSAKQITIETEEGTISGNYFLRDRLQLESGSGNVFVSVEQQPRAQRVSDEALKYVTPSVLRTTTVTGDTDVDLSYSREVDAPTFVFDNSTGQWTAHEHAEYDGYDDGYTDRWDLWDFFLADALHTSDSGSMVLRYGTGWGELRTEWDGTVEGFTGTGSVAFRGRGGNPHQLVVPNITSTANGEHLRAILGSGNSTMKFNASRGDVDVSIGRY